MSKMSELALEQEEGRLLSESFDLSRPADHAEVAKPPRTVETVTLEIRMLQKQAQQIMLGYAVEIGRRLEEVKAILPHGQWGEYLKNEVAYSQSTANNFMRIYREYGAAQQSLFGGEAKSQAFANLTYTKALRLLAIPDEEERERFIAEHDVENMSSRELDKALKARDEAREEAAAAQEEARRLNSEVGRLNEQLSNQERSYTVQLASVQADANNARSEADRVRATLETQKDKAKRLQDALSEANNAAQAAEDEHDKLLRELEALRSRPAEADIEAVEAARKAAIDEMTAKVDKAKDAKKKADEKRKAAEEALDAAKKELAELKAKGPEVRGLTQEEKDALVTDAVAKARAENAERMQALEKQLAQADPDTATFKVLFVSWQETYGKMMEALEQIKAKDNSKAEKLQCAIRAVVGRMQ